MRRLGGRSVEIGTAIERMPLDPFARQDTRLSVITTPYGILVEHAHLPGSLTPCLWHRPGCRFASHPRCVDSEEEGAPFLGRLRSGRASQGLAQGRADLRSRKWRAEGHADPR